MVAKEQEKTKPANWQPHIVSDKSEDSGERKQKIYNMC